MILSWRHFLCVVFALFFSVSPLLAGESNTCNKLPVAKYSIDDSSLRQRWQEASCELKIDENFNYYDIEGSSVADLKQQMGRGGTKWTDGKVYAALTTWKILYNYKIIERAGNYSIASIVTNLSLVYHLPHWTVVTAAPELLAWEWEVYMENLMDHEYGHKDLSVKTAIEINQTLASLGSFGSKEELDKEAKRLVAERFKRLKELHIAYDDATSHGIKQGAVLEESSPARTAFLATKAKSGRPHGTVGNN